MTKTINTNEAAKITRNAIEFERKLIARFLENILPDETLADIRSGQYKNKLVNGPICKCSDPLSVWMFQKGESCYRCGHPIPVEWLRNCGLDI